MYQRPCDPHEAGRCIKPGPLICPHVIRRSKSLRITGVDPCFRLQLFLGMLSPVVGMGLALWFGVKGLRYQFIHYA